MKKNTRTEIRRQLYTYAAKQQGDFRTEQAKNSLTGCGNVRLDNFRVASFLKGNETHVYNKNLKKWVKKRQ